MTENIDKLPEVTRVEVISGNGREYVNLSCRNVQIVKQDDGRTLKILINLPIEKP